MGVLKNIGSLAVCAEHGGPAELDQIRGAALAWEAGRITWVGPESELPAELAAAPALDAGGGLVIPGLVDCHTHLAFGGWRAQEFEQRALGVSYLDIARSGGGIRRTVAQTRQAGEEELVDRAEVVLGRMARLGITTVEAKSGYGLDLENELKLLRVYRRLAQRQPVRVMATFLGAHVVPPEYAGASGSYVDRLCEEMIPAVAEQQLARFCDVFVEEGAFSAAEARRILRAGRRWGLRPKLHVDQLRDGDGARLAAEMEAVSADHLEHVSAEGIEALARAGVVAVALPLASLYLRQPPMPARRLLDGGVDLALATDFNPGSAPSYHLPLALMLGCVLCGLRPAEALRAGTIGAARALGLETEVGSLEVGKWADWALIDAPDPGQWLYHFRGNACRRTFIRGEEVFAASGVEPC